jgi:purine-nucleoside phosphorylase
MSYEKAASAADFIRSKFAGEVGTAIVLGSGLGAFGDSLENAIAIPYNEIPGFVQSTVEGHAGQLVIGTIAGKNVLVQQGRFHFYEGYDMDQVTLPVRTFGVLGVKNLILTNAAGSLNPAMPAGTLMLIEDQLNCFPVNPLRGPNDSRFGPRFPDMSEVYDRGFKGIAREEAAKIAAEKGVSEFLGSGVYCGLPGPTYETPAEIRMFKSSGADAVGMSTVPEAIVARHQGMRTLGISCITNLAAGLQEEIDHSEVMETGARVAEVFGELLRRVVARI